MEPAFRSARFLKATRTSSLQRWTEVNLSVGRAKAWGGWAQAEVEPSVVHFAGGGKDDPVYKAHVQQCWAAAHACEPTA